MQPSPLQPTTLTLSGERLRVTYELTGDSDRTTAIAEQLVIEQTIEFPPELVPDDDILGQILGRIESSTTIDNGIRIQVSYAEEIVGGQLPQLLNVLFGNMSMVPGVKVVDVELPDSLKRAFPGPRHGLAGLRHRFGVESGPLLATALKPMGTPIDRLASLAGQMAVGGISLIKDDHSFATQPFADFRQRVVAIADAVNSADSGSIYLPALNVPMDELPAAATFALEAGAGGLLVLPGIFGFDTMRWLSQHTPDHTVIMSHPALLGSFVASRESGFSHSVMFGQIPRLAGADVSIFPNYGGRFAFPQDDCAAIAQACTAPDSTMRPAWPCPAGGMSVERVPNMVRFYGVDTCLLIGGDLYRGSIAEQAERIAEALRHIETEETTA